MGLWGGRPSSDPSFALMCSFISLNSDFRHSADETDCSDGCKGLG